MLFTHRLYFTHRLCFTKQPISGADNSFLKLSVLSNIFVLKLKIHLCDDAISLTSLISSMNLIVYIFICY